VIKKVAGGVCLNFWYLAFGKTVGELSIYTRKRTQLSEEPIWSIRGDQGERWRPAAITINEYEDFQVKIFQILLA
jgi:hypothetical protein